jgi:hypothetical protein
MTTSAGFAAAAGPLLPGADISPERFVSRMIVGGIGSRLAGYNFANGATSAAFAYLFNDVGSLKDRRYISNELRDRVATVMLGRVNDGPGASQARPPNQLLF